jgi:hypothetical protein
MVSFGTKSSTNSFDLIGTIEIIIIIENGNWEWVLRLQLPTHQQRRPVP